MIGYSWGGGLEYNISKNIAAYCQQHNENLSLMFAAYIDGIERSDGQIPSLTSLLTGFRTGPGVRPPNAEATAPAGAKNVDDFYETNCVICHGSALSNLGGATFISGGLVNTDGGRSVGHADNFPPLDEGIDKVTSIQTAIENDLVTTVFPA